MTDILYCEKPDDVRFLTVAQTIWCNGERHLANFNRYTLEGKNHHATGSLRKACRNFTRAKRLSFDIRMDGIPDAYLKAANTLRDAIASAILNGAA